MNSQERSEIFVVPDFSKKSSKWVKWAELRFMEAWFWEWFSTLVNRHKLLWNGQCDHGDGGLIDRTGG